MDRINIRALRNHGGDVLDRVIRGETLTVTRNGRPIAELRPLPRRPLTSDVLLSRWSRLPMVDAAKLRTEIDSLLEPALSAAASQ